MLLLFFYSSISCMAQQRTLLALSKADHTLAIVDPVSFKIIAKVPVGNDPHEVIASSDGKTAYVSILQGGRSHEIDVIDLVAQKRLPDIDTRPLIGPHGLDFAKGKMWFSAEGSKSFGVYDPASSKTEWSLGTGQDRTHMIFVTPDAKRVYTTNVNAGTVSIFVDTLLPMGGPPPPQPGGANVSAPPPGMQPRSQWMHTVVAVARGCEGFDVSPDGKELWTASSDDGMIYIVDLATKKMISTIDAKTFGANRVKFTPDGKKIVVSTLRSGDLFVFDVASHKEIKRINIGHGAAGILMDPDGSRAFIGCTPDNYVAVIDLKKLEMINHIDVGGGPDGLAWAVR
ncbi:MAG: YncE family protein [Bacteroidetes bacterium]|nr:YncE family protein [Bacteroidota bacterium]